MKECEGYPKKKKSTSPTKREKSSFIFILKYKRGGASPKMDLYPRDVGMRVPREREHP